MDTGAPTENGHPVKPQRKRLIVCCDGTWQASDTPGRYVESNVTRIARALRKQGTVRQNIEVSASGVEKHEEVIEQMVFYQSGIGTGYFTNAARKFAGGTGSGFVENVMRAYSFISGNFKFGDEIYLFGFSRGAYTVRVLSGILTAVGILKKKHLRHIIPMFDNYLDKNQNQADQTENVVDERLRKFIEDLIRETACQLAMRYVYKHDKTRSQPISPEDISDTGTRILSRTKKILDSTLGDVIGDLFEVYGTEILKVLDEDFNKGYGRLQSGQGFQEKMIKIEIIGCWDTVGSLGIPIPIPFISERLQTWFNLYHFKDPKVSDTLDEHRRPFSPSLWHMDKETNKNTELIQCWFPGCHINTGGGSPADVMCVRCAYFKGFDKEWQCPFNCYEKGKDSDRGQLADLSLAWMIDLCRPYLDFEDDFIEALYARHYMVGANLKYDRYRGDETLSKITQGAELDRIPAWADPTLGSFSDSFDEMPEGLSRIRTPGEYHPDNNEEVVSTSQEWKELHTKWVTHEYIHPSARIRLEYVRNHWISLNGPLKKFAWDSPTNLKALRYFRLEEIKPGKEPYQSATSEPNNLTNNHHYEDRHKGLGWRKITSDGEETDLVLPEWAVDSQRFQELSSKRYGENIASVEKGIMTGYSREDTQYKDIEESLGFTSKDLISARKRLPPQLDREDTLLENATYMARAILRKELGDVSSLVSTIYNGTVGRL